LDRLDEKAWDVVAVAIAAFSQRTKGKVYDEEFPLLLSDYFDWRGIPANHRNIEAIREVQARILLLSDRDRVKIYSQVDLHLPDTPGTKTVIAEGPLFDGGKPFWKNGQLPLLQMG
jgi:hypothetical protein